MLPLNALHNQRSCTTPTLKPKQLGLLSQHTLPLKVIGITIKTYNTLTLS